MTTSAQLRSHARESLRGKWKMAILITLGASVVGLVSIIVRAAVEWNTYSRLNFGNMSLLNQLHTSEIDWSTIMLTLVYLAISTMLWLGLIHYNIQISRGQEVGFPILFSRSHIWLKGLGQIIMIYLFMMGWCFAFLAPFLLLVYVFRYTPHFLLTVGPIVIFCGLVVVFLRYAMSTYLLADDPDMGIMESIRESKRMMTGQKGRFFKLMLSFLGWMVLTFGIQFVVWHVSYLVAIIVGFCCSLVYQTYMNASIAAFYLDLKGELNLKR